MTYPNTVVHKTRNLVNTASLTADASLPAWPSQGDNPMVYYGDFTGAQIGGFEFECGALDTITALDCTIEHSDDGENWYTLKSLTQKTAAAKTYNELDDTDPKPMKYLRATLAATGSYGSAASVQVSVKFNQCGPRGKMAPPGRRWRLS